MCFTWSRLLEMLVELSAFFTQWEIISKLPIYVRLLAYLMSLTKLCDLLCWFHDRQSLAWQEKHFRLNWAVSRLRLLPGCITLRWRQDSGVFQHRRPSWCETSVLVWNKQSQKKIIPQLHCKPSHHELLVVPTLQVGPNGIHHNLQCLVKCFWSPSIDQN